MTLEIVTLNWTQYHPIDEESSSSSKEKCRKWSSMLMFIYFLWSFLKEQEFPKQLALFHDGNNLWEIEKPFQYLKLRIKWFIISFNLDSIVSQPSNPRGSPTIILYSNINLEKLSGPSATYCSKWEAEN